MGSRAIFVGELMPGSTSEQRFSALQRLGLQVESIRIRRAQREPWAERVRMGLKSRLYQRGINLPLSFDPLRVNQQILEKVDSTVSLLWLDKALTVRRETLEQVRVRAPNCRIVGFSADDMSRRHNRSAEFERHAALYHFFFSNKTTAPQALAALGCRTAHFVGNAYDPAVHRPIEVTSAERAEFGGGVGFIGTYEHDRAEMILALGRAGIPVRVWGTRWPSMPKSSNVTVEGRALYGDDYVKALCSFEINLCFLRKLNGDLQTTRSIEIPATGSFMLAERTVEHEALFAEGQEADFFSDSNDLTEKCRYYLGNSAERQAIAHRGLLRCLSSGYGVEARLRAMLAMAGIVLPAISKALPA